MHDAPTSIYDVDVTTIDGRPLSMREFRGRVLLIVNVASQCGFTPQYADLEALHRTYAPQGFSVLGFPCDQFGGQEPGTEAEILRFCADQFDVTFPLFAKIAVNGPHAHPLYRFLKSQKKGLLGSSAIKWNFTKFLVDAGGRVLRRYGSAVPPQRVEQDVRRQLQSAG